MCPIYEYFCEKCNIITEYIRPYERSDQVQVCGTCLGESAYKQISVCGWNLPGSGWPGQNIKDNRNRQRDKERGVKGG